MPRTRPTHGASSRHGGGGRLDVDDHGGLAPPVFEKAPVVARVKTLEVSVPAHQILAGETGAARAGGVVLQQLDDQPLSASQGVDQCGQLVPTVDNT